VAIQGDPLGLPFHALDARRLLKFRPESALKPGRARPVVAGSGSCPYSPKADPQILDNESTTRNLAAPIFWNFFGKFLNPFPALRDMS
jgi:hypothetical protein